MRKIRAFVGHSFTDADSAIVAAFTRMFDNLNLVMPEFTWDHAELSRPISISEKVLELTNNKNIFIGIYTRKELVLRGDIPRAWHQRMRLTEANFEWKTSDWILQETGLARGRNFPSIFFVEDGVRPPNGLNADLEWIPFQRSHPERAYGKFLQMVGSLRDNTETSVSAETESALSPPPPQTSDEALPTEPNTHWPEPQPDWPIGAFEVALLRAIGAPDKQKSVVAAFESSPLSRDETIKHGWNAFREWVLISFDKGGDIARLRLAAEAHPGNPSVRYYYGRVLQGFDRWDDAASEFVAAADATNDPVESVRYLGAAAESLRSAGQQSKSALVLSKARDLINDSRAVELSYLRRQRELATEAKSTPLLIGTLERWLDLEPSDVDARFSLAYAYDELGERELSLYHYLLIPHADRKGSTWNNLGVVRDHLGLPGLSVQSFRKAIDQGEALSGSNLANKLIDVGFRDEAEAILERAQSLPIRHKNVLDSLKRVAEMEEEEDKKQEAIRVRARKNSEFFINLGKASTKPLPKDTPNRWTGKKLQVDAVFSQSSFSATGEFEEPASGLAALFIPTDSSTTASTTARKIKIDFSGSLWGSAVIGQVTRSRVNASTLLTGLLSTFDVLLYVAQSGAQLHILEYGTNHREHYVLEPY